MKTLFLNKNTNLVLNYTELNSLISELFRIEETRQEPVKWYVILEGTLRSSDLCKSLNAIDFYYHQISDKKECNIMKDIARFIFANFTFIFDNSNEDYESSFKSNGFFY